MLKITETETNGSRVLLKLEGKITAQWAALLGQECRAALRKRRAVELDCAGVDFLDESGVAVLRRLPRKRVTLMNVSGYLTELLQSGGQP
jgi:anti-anti-sigma regulatory factor